ncbi:hypothetical protein D3C81_2275540 [compost metagenome]
MLDQELVEGAEALEELVAVEVGGGHDGWVSGGDVGVRDGLFAGPASMLGS